VSIYLERIFARPDFLHNFQRGIAADGMNSEQPPPGPIARASGAMTRVALNSAEALDRYGCDAMIRS
jgi:hypothetical protein